MVVNERSTNLFYPGYSDLLLPVLRLSFLHQIVVNLPGAEDQFTHLQLSRVKSERVAKKYKIITELIVITVYSLKLGTSCNFIFTFLPPTNEVWGQGNVFTPVCHSDHRGGLCLGGLCPRGVYVCTVKSGRYASYCSIFLFKLRFLRREWYKMCI